MDSNSMDLYDIAAQENQELRVHDNLKPNRDVIRQGDIYLHYLGATEDRAAMVKRVQKVWNDFNLGPVGPVIKVTKPEDLQLVSDTTIGARHCIRFADRNVVKVYAPSTSAHALEGPVIVASGRFTLEHPEHAAHECPEGTYQVLYQRDFLSDEARRVQD